MKARFTKRIREMRVKRIWLWAGVVALFVSFGARSQPVPGAYAWEEFSKRIKASEKVEPLGPNLAGEVVSLSNGGLSFAATDVSLPGNNSLKVEFRRTYSVFSRKDYGDLGMLADWLVDLPSISAVFAPNWVLGLNDSTNRCSQDLIPRVDAPFRQEDYWQGIQINIPGVDSGELLWTLPGTQKPADGAVYYWLTNARTHVSCLPSIKNPGTGQGVGQGFLARTPDGTRYWFDWMGQTREPATTIVETDTAKNRTPRTLARKKNYLYVTRVEDRFGNYVTYTYTNSWNEPGKLARIEANDGRFLSMAYTGETISSVTDGARTWNYGYQTTASGRNSLSTVTLPDSSSWGINLSEFTSAEIKYYEFPPVGEVLRTCFDNEVPLNVNTNFVGSITHPAGAKVEFTVNSQEHGRSWVPVNCRNFKTTFTSGPNKGADNFEGDDINIYATRAYSLTLAQKKITGPGLAEAIWTYSYEPNALSMYFYPGTSYRWPICDVASGIDCSQPPCTNDNCATYSITTVSGPGEWKRYRHGNTYRYNEGKLLQVETGTGPTGVLRTERYSYDLSRVDQVYPARFGRSLRLEGEGFASEYHRPGLETEILQQGKSFKRLIDLHDKVARPTQVTSVSSAEPGNPPVPPSISTPILTAPATAVAAEFHSLSWASVANAVLYVLERSIDNGSYATVYSGNSLSTELTFAGASTLRYRLRACGSFGQCSAYSAVKTVTVSAPINLGAPVLNAPTTGYLSNAFLVTWTPVSNADKYILEWREGSSGSFTTAYVGTISEATVAKSLPMTVFFRVKACDATTNCGLYSNVDSTQVVDQQEP